MHLYFDRKRQQFTDEQGQRKHKKMILILLYLSKIIKYLSLIIIQLC